MGPSIQLLARDEVLLEGLRALIGSSGSDAGAVAKTTGDVDFCRVPKEQLPDILVVDAEMVGDNPYATISALRRCHPDLCIIVMVFAELPFPLLNLLEVEVSGLIHVSEATHLPEVAGASLPRSGVWLSSWARSTIVDSYTTSDLFNLSKRELSVMELVEDGMSNKAIAERLSLSVRTVDFHVHNALGKLRARNRTEAVKLLNRARYGG